MSLFPAAFHEDPLVRFLLAAREEVSRLSSIENRSVKLMVETDGPDGESFETSCAALVEELPGGGLKVEGFEGGSIEENVKAALAALPEFLGSSSNGRTSPLQGDDGGSNPSGSTT